MVFSIFTELYNHHHDHYLALKMANISLLFSPAQQLPSWAQGWVLLLPAEPATAVGTQLMPVELYSDLLEKLSLHTTVVWALSKAQWMRE